MTPQIKQRIEQIRRGEVPEGYKKTKVGIIPDEWNEECLGKYLQEYKELSNDIENYPVYSSSRQGLIPQSQYYDNREAVETNLGYKIVPNGYVTYRHMSDDDIFHFNVNKTGSEVLVSSEYPVFTSTKKGDLGYLIPMLNGTARFRYFCRTQKMGGTRTRLYYKNLCTYKTAFATLPEQQKIAEILSAQDKLIALKEKLIEEKKRQKKALMQQLLTGKKRLPGFSGAWVAVKLGDIFAERVETNCQDLELLSVTGTNGVVPRSTIETKDNSSEDKSKYLKICKGDIGYNTMRMWQGVSALSEYEGIVSPAYTILIPSPEISAKYFSYLFKMHAVIFLFYRFSQGIVDDTRSLKYYEFAKLHLTVPSDKKEQEAIADILTVADKEIEILQKDLDQEKQKKKALMQLLLTGIVRVEVNE